jgi:hypothetical protein
MPTMTDCRPPGDLAVLCLMLADPTLTVEEARREVGLPVTDDTDGE